MKKWDFIYIFKKFPSLLKLKESPCVFLSYTTLKIIYKLLLQTDFRLASNISKQFFIFFVFCVSQFFTFSIRFKFKIYNT